MKTVPLLINGELVSSSAEHTIDVTNPANNDVIARVPCATTSEINEAIDSAKRAFETWKMCLSPSARG